MTTTGNLEPRGDPSSLLVRFSDEDVTEAEAVMRRLDEGRVRTLSTNQAFRTIRSRDPVLRRYRHLGVVGEPPEDGLGYGLAAVLAAVIRAEQVTMIDSRLRRVRRQGRARYLATAMPAAAAQLGVSGTAVVLQRALAQLLLARGVPSLELRGHTLDSLLYIRPLVGVPAGVGGSVSHAHGVIRAFRDVGIEIDALTNDPSIASTAAMDPDPPCRWRVIGVPRIVKAVPASLALGADAALTLAGRRSARGSEAIYQRHMRFSLVGALLAFVTRRPLILEYNGSEAFFDTSYHSTPFAGQLQLCEDAILAASSLVVVTSQVDKEDLIERGVDVSRIVLNPNGVDPQAFARGGGAEIRRRLGLAEGHALVGFVGSFGPWHGAPRLAEAFAEISQARPRYRLLLVGDGPDRATVREILERTGASEKAIFAGKIPPAEVPAHLDACDVLVSPHVPLDHGARFFGSPTKLFEYMASGKGIVASALEQIGDVLDHGRSALLVTPGDAAELGAAIMRLADSPELAAKLGAHARQDAIEKHSWKLNVQRVIAAYEALAAS